MSEPETRSLWRLAPLGVFALLAILLFARLFAGDSSHVPSPLIGRPAPPFNLPAVEGLAGVSGVSDADLRQGQVSVLNVFASWCPPCRSEHHVLMALARDERLKAAGLRLFGLAYKDEAANVRRFLEDEGNPFAAVGADLLGLTGIDLGVYGVPETYLVGGDGVILFKYVGPLTPQTLATELTPRIEKALSANKAAATPAPAQ